MGSRPRLRQLTEAEATAELDRRCREQGTGPDGEPERVRVYDRDGVPHDIVARTKSGRVLTEADLNALSDEAEHGYVVRDTDGTIVRGPSLPCGCPLDSGCDGWHPGRLP